MFDELMHYALWAKHFLIYSLMIVQSLKYKLLLTLRINDVPPTIPDFLSLSPLCLWAPLK